VERARSGDTMAYEELVRLNQEIAVRVAYVLTGDADAAGDAAQSAFIKAYYALDRFRSGAPFRPWLLKIVANEARNAARSAQRRRSYEFAAGRPQGDAAPSPEGAVMAGLDREMLLRAVNCLPARDQEAIACRYFLELSEAEIAAALGCARGTVKSRLSRALGRLRGILTDEERPP
jgi:RNA polymerase sigma-70 factor (ECF subfamily)